MRQRYKLYKFKFTRRSVIPELSMTKLQSFVPAFEGEVLHDWNNETRSESGCKVLDTCKDEPVRSMKYIVQFDPKRASAASNNPKRSSAIPVGVFFQGVVAVSISGMSLHRRSLC